MAKKTEKQTARELIFVTIEDLAADFMYYDRKGDESLPRDAIEEAVAQGKITVDEIVDKFRRSLRERGLK